MADRLEHAELFDQLHSTFRLRLDDPDIIEVELAEVSELKRTGNQEAFSIVFLARTGTVMPQRIYRLEHDKLGPHDLFLVPIRKNDAGVYYEAVFNRFV